MHVAVESIMHVMSTLDIVIGERFHSLVTASSGGVPFVALSYDEKVSELAIACGLSEYCIDLVEAMENGSLCSELITTFSSLRASLDEVRQTMREKVSSMRTSARSDCEYIRSDLQQHMAGSRSTSEREYDRDKILFASCEVSLRLLNALGVEEVVVSDA